MSMTTSAVREALAYLAYREMGTPVTITRQEHTSDWLLAGRDGAIEISETEVGSALRSEASFRDLANRVRWLVDPITWFIDNAPRKP